MHAIHPTAIVSPETILGEDVEIGPFCVLEGDVRLGNGVKLLGNVRLAGPVTIGAETMLYPGACVGFPGQDFKFKPGMPTAGVKIGEKCILREHVTVHAATKVDRPTTVGNNVMMMACSHVGHDGTVGNNVVMVNGSLVAGHATLADQVILSGIVAVHQFCRVGRLAFGSGGAVTSTDIPPFCVFQERNRLGGVNLVGMRRSGIPREQIKLVMHAYKQVLHSPSVVAEMLETLDRLGAGCEPVMEIRRFIAEAKRPIAPGLGRPTREMVAYMRNVRKGRAVLAPEESEELA